MKNIFKIFIGYDSREKIAYHVLSHSIISNATIPVQITPINLKNLKRFYKRPKAKNHSTEFSISRFLAPYLSNYQGLSLYLDCDFIMLGDVAKLLSFVSKKPNKVLWCVKHRKYIPKDKFKFLREKQLPYAKKNWSSFMVFNNAKCKILTPKFVAKAHGLILHQFKWTKENQIGSLPKNWNILVGEQKIPKKVNALHYTLGGPYFKKHSKCQGAKHWFKYKKQILM
mgnify:CR=1 FL=1|tara:strand:- start:459 stop:1136 length:678 start_codon:yes stop_codon:yes gene_type:complete